MRVMHINFKGIEMRIMHINFKGIKIYYCEENETGFWQVEDDNLKYPTIAKAKARANTLLGKNFKSFQCYYGGKDTGNFGIVEVTSITEDCRYAWVKIIKQGDSYCYGGSRMKVYLSRLLEMNKTNLDNYKKIEKLYKQSKELDKKVEQLAKKFKTIEKKYKNVSDDEDTENE